MAYRGECPGCDKWGTLSPTSRLCPSCSAEQEMQDLLAAAAAEQEAQDRACAGPEYN